MLTTYACNTANTMAYIAENLRMKLEINVHIRKCYIFTQ